MSASQTPAADAAMCPACAETIKAKAFKCKHCGTDLNSYAEHREAFVERGLFEGHPDVIYSVRQLGWVVMTLGLAALKYYFESRATKVTITSQRVKIETGMISKDLQALELFRVQHFEVLRPLDMRLLGYCVLHVRSSDPALPDLRLYGIKKLHVAAENLRDLALKERDRRRVAF